MFHNVANTVHTVDKVSNLAKIKTAEVVGTCTKEKH